MTNALGLLFPPYLVFAPRRTIGGDTAAEIERQRRENEAREIERQRRAGDAPPTLPPPPPPPPPFSATPFPGYDVFGRPTTYDPYRPGDVIAPQPLPTSPPVVVPLPPEPPVVVVPEPVPPPPVQTPPPTQPSPILATPMPGTTPAARPSTLHELGVVALITSPIWVPFLALPLLRKAFAR